MATKAKATEATVAAENSNTDISASKAEKAQNEANSEATEDTGTVTYTVGEFAKAAATVFGKPLHQDIVRAAFKMAGKAEATKTEAAQIVGNFLNKEVKVK